MPCSGRRQYDDDDDNDDDDDDEELFTSHIYLRKARVQRQAIVRRQSSLYFKFFRCEAP